MSETKWWARCLRMLLMFAIITCTGEKSSDDQKASGGEWARFACRTNGAIT